MGKATVSALAAALLFASGCGAVRAAGPVAGAGPDPGATITVQGQAKIPVPVSTATFTAGVRRQAATAQQALSADNAAAQQLIAALQKAGVAKKDLTTTDLSVQPQYAYQNGQAPRLTGYTATDTLQVKVADASKVGPVIDAASAGGATQLGDVSFGPPDGDTLEQQALAAAVGDARARAVAIAAQANLRLGAVEKVSMQTVTPPVRTASVMAVAAPQALTTPVETGTQLMEATVTVTFAAG